MNSRLFAAVLLGVLSLSSSADAGSVLYSQTIDPDSSGNVTDAHVTAEFSDVVGGQFTLTLSYLSATVGSHFDNGAVLTGFTWNATGNPAITAVSAVIAAGSQLIETSGTTVTPVDPQPSNINYGWAYRSNLSGTYGPYGVGAAGGSGDPSFGANDRINSTSTIPLDGVDYGVVPVLASGKGFNNGLKDPVVQSSIVLTFNVGPGSTFDPMNDITDAYFLFGSNLTPHSAGGGTHASPEPSSLALLSIGIVGVAGAARRRRRRASSQQQTDD